MFGLGRLQLILRFASCRCYLSRRAGKKVKNVKKVKFEISGDDFREGLTAVISIKVMEPQFEGQTKTKLGNKEVTSAVSQSVSDMLSFYLEENPAQAQIIVQKIMQD